MKGFGDGSGISWTMCKQSASCFRQITTTTSHSSIFYRPDALPDAQPTVSKYWRQDIKAYLTQSINRSIQRHNTLPLPKVGVTSINTLVSQQHRLMHELRHFHTITVTLFLIGQHTHPFNGPLSETTRVCRYQKGKTNLDFTGHILLK